MSVSSAVTAVAKTAVGNRRPVLATRRARTVSFAVAVVAVGLLAAAVSPAEPTELAFANVFWRGALAAVTAYLAGTARRWTWFVPAGVAAPIVGNGLALVCAALAIGIGLWSVVTDTRSRARGALVGGLGCVALLRADPIAFHGFTALLTAAAIAPVAISGYRNAGRRAQARLRKIAGIVGGILALIIGGAVLGLVSVSRDLTRGASLIDDGIVAARDADDDLAGERLQQAARHLTSADATLTSWFVTPARIVPVLGPNLDAVESLARETGDVAQISAAAADVADVDQLRFVGGRLDLQAVTDMIEPLEDTVDALEGLSNTVDRTDSPWLVAPMADRIEQVESQLDDASPDARLALDAVRLAPELLGGSGPKRYLVLFVTPVEARGRIGFPGNYAELLFENGQMSMPRFGRILELEQQGVPGPQRQLSQPPDYVARYSRFDVAETWRNLTMGADFPSVAVAIRDLYPQSGGQPIDGVMAIDPVGLAALLRYTGPVEVPGHPEPLTEENAARFLELDQYVDFTDVSQRIDVLETVARTTFDRLTSADLPSPSDVSAHLDPVVDGGHIQIVPFDPTAYVMFEGYHLTGSLAGGSSDPGEEVVGVTTSNAGASKIDLFLERGLRYDLTWDPDQGQVTGTITALLHNTAPSSGLPNYVIGNSLGLPLGTNRSYVSIYTRHDATAMRVDGQPVPTQSETEAQHNVYSTFVTIPPGGTVIVELDVAGTVEGDRLQVDVAQQPLVWPEQAEVNVTVAGGADLEIGGEAEAELNDRTAHWAGPMDRRRTLVVEAG
ncbi:MAG TPA: DUF4012 domain-containing protein [Acidimicrobiales bacterium]